ncbi:MAG TPA: helix-turn-helix domain-containing protein [Burkholderiaceae bacterium]|nr:helix-turn-helix domain-containing protein [Burkholderiaceae bacterium]
MTNESQELIHTPEAPNILAEQDVQSESAPEISTQEQPQLSAGQLIKQARTNAGLHIAALAVTLKVPVKRLEALEDDNLNVLPDMVFVRALAASVCNTLKIDPEPILALMPKTGSTRLDTASQSIDTPLRSALSNDKVNPLDLIKTPWMIGGAVLLLGAAAIYFWPAMKSDSAKTIQESKASGASEMATKESNAISVTPIVATPVLAANAAAGMTTTANQPSTSSTSTNTAATDGIVTFKATGDTWIEVKDAKGNTVFKQLMKAGESAGANGVLPLSVTVGSTNYTQVMVRGVPKDLTKIAKNEVAFFEVK